MYYIYFYVFDYTSQDGYPTESAAKQAAIETGFTGYNIIYKGGK